MKKKLVTGALLAAFGAVAVTGGTLAYFTDTDAEDNTFTVGNVNIELTEPAWGTPEQPAQGMIDAEDVYPGEALAKNPIVTNEGANPCFVRVKVTGWEALSPASKITYRTDYVDGKLGDNWVYSESDDYFYYTKVLPVATEGSTAHITDALFDQIVIPTDVTNGFDGTYTLTVKAEAVQAQGARPSFSAVQQMTAADIQAWFGVCMADAGVEPQA